MKHKYLTLAAALTAIFALTVVALGTSQAAGTGLYLSPATKSVAQGSKVAIAIRANTGSGVNAVQANLTYPTDKFDYVSTSYSGSAFSVQAESSGGGGNIRIARGSLGLVTGDRLVATITLKAKTDSGDATVSFAAGSDLASDGGSVPASKTGGTYTFTPAPVATPLPPTPIPAVKDTAPPIISVLNIKQNSSKAFTVTWQTNEPADSVVEYGIDTNYGLTVSAPGAVIAHEVQVASAFILPLMQYHYRVKSQDAAGNAALSPDQKLTTTGIPILFTVKDKQGHPLKDAEVTLDGNHATTNGSGQASLESNLGTKIAAITYQGHSTTQTVTIRPEDAAKKPIAYTIVLSATSEPASWWTLAAVLLAILASSIALIVAFRQQLWLFILHRSSSTKSAVALPPQPADSATSTPPPASSAP